MADRRDIFARTILLDKKLSPVVHLPVNRMHRL